MILSNPEIEACLIGTALAAPKSWHELSFVNPQDFTDQTAAAVWEEIGNFSREGRKVDPTLLAAAISQNPEDQATLRVVMSDWVTNLVSTINGPEYARIVKDLAERRKIAAAAKDIIALAENEACGLNAAEIASHGIAQLAHGQLDCLDFVPSHEISELVEKNLDKAIPVFKTGFHRLDKALGGGFYQNRFYGFGARMKSGKSLLMSTIAYQMAMHQGARILYLCLEMGSEESMQRIMAMHMGINSLCFLKPEFRTQQWFRHRASQATLALKNTKLYFRSEPRMTLDELKAVIARAGMSGKVDGIIIDYLQLVEGKAKNQSSAEHFDNVAQTLAEAVKRHPIWILSAAQLNREGNVRGSDGLLMACDLALSINKKEGSVFTGNDGSQYKDPDKAWLETMVSRYTQYTDIGSETDPGYEICLDRGPCFVELGNPQAQREAA